MPRYTRRIAVALAVAWAVSSIVFLTIRMVPGDPAMHLLSRAGATPDASAIAETRAQLGIDRPILTQYFDDFRQLLGGDLGRSLRDGTAVGSTIAIYLPRSLEMLVIAILLGALIGIPAGVFAALHPRSLLDDVGCWFSEVVRNVPIFVSGTLLALVFAPEPLSDASTSFPAFTDDPLAHLATLALPVATIGLGFAAGIFRETRTAVMDVSGSDFVLAARARGLDASYIILRHIFRNALVPMIAALPRLVAVLSGAAVLVEYLFGYPGLCGVLAQAAKVGDYPLVQGIVLILSLLLIALDLAADLLCSVLDPRVSPI